MLVAYVSNAGSAEISVLSLHADSGAVGLLQTVPVGGAVMPLALSRDWRTLYAAMRSAPFRVASFRIDGHTGLLTPLAEAPLPDSMAFIGTDRSGRWLFAASYGGHVMSISPLAADGVPGPAQQTLATGLKTHAAVPSPDNRHLFVPHLGSDQVTQLRFDAATGQATPNEPLQLPMRAQSGPRHLVFHPLRPWAYLLNELDASVDLLDFDASLGTLSPRRNWSTLPAGFSGNPWAADLHPSPDGRFLYTSERTSSTLAMWRIDAASGELELIGHQATETQPRGFQIDPTGRWLLAVGQVSNGLTSYRIDPASGRLSPVASLPLGQGPNWVEIVDLR